MDEETKNTVQATYKLAEENNEMLHKMRRSQKWATVWRIFYWAVIIILSFGTYYLIQPYINALQSATGGKVNFDQVFKNFGQ